MKPFDERGLRALILNSVPAGPELLITNAFYEISNDLLAHETLSGDPLHGQEDAKFDDMLIFTVLKTGTVLTGRFDGGPAGETARAEMLETLVRLPGEARYEPSLLVKAAGDPDGYATTLICAGNMTFHASGRTLRPADN